MADSALQLEEYKLQLQQVEATLTVDPENEELKKLKGDLLEVIQLTQDLINAQSLENVPEAREDGPHTASSSVEPMSTTVSHTWNVGDKCMAFYNADELYYPATIDEVLQDGTCTVTFEGYDNTEVTQLSLLKPREESSDLDAKDGKSYKATSKKDKAIAEREYKRKKSQKKAQRMKQLEEEHETEKNKWLDFNTKTFSKTNK